MRPTLEELTAWMKVTPRTFNWNAIVAYDRTKTNIVLLQDYIRRFSTDSYFPPLSGEVPTTENEVEWVYDYLVDTPRLSFENSIISASKAHLTMHILGGAQITIASEAGRDPAVIRVASFDALQGPRYTVKVDLLYAEGSVDSAGKVQLDVSSGSEPLLYFAPTTNQRIKGGQFMKGRLEALRPEIKIFVINEIGSQEGQFLQPENFVLRTHAEPGATVKNAANAGEGEVLLFVTMKGEANGTIPAADKDMQFLIPAGDYSAAILMDQRFLLKRILSEGCRRLSHDNDIQIELIGPPETFAEGMTVSGGELVYNGVMYENLPNFHEIFVNSVNMQVGANFQLAIQRDKELITLHWEGLSSSLCHVITLNNFKRERIIRVSWRVQQAFKFESVDVTGELKLVAVADGKVKELKVSPGDFTNVEDVAPHIVELVNALEGWLSGVLDQALSDFASVVQEIDVFRLNSLLFHGPEIVRFTHSQSPGDLALFGELAPDLTSFSITPLEPLVFNSANLQFATQPTVPGVTWKVENIEGGTGNPGGINASGLYSAPPKTEIPGQFTRVRVTASAGEYSSSALVTVLTRDITINPFVQICSASSDTSTSTRELEAGSLSGGALTWAVAGNTGSSVVVSTVPEGDHTFVARKKDPAAFITMDEVVVTDSAGKSDSSWVVVVHKPLLGQVIIGSQPLPEGQVQLQMDIGLGPIDPEMGADAGMVWTVLKGGGRVGAKGIYESDPASQFRFAVVSVMLPGGTPVHPPYESFIILPLPLISLPTLRSALARSDAYFKAAAVLGMERAAELLAAGN